MQKELKKQFLYFNTWAAFQKALNENEGFKDNPNCIVFIANSDQAAKGKRGVIWTHGTLFGEGEVLDEYATTEYIDQKIALSEGEIEKLRDSIEYTNGSITNLTDEYLPRNYVAKNSFNDLLYGNLNLRTVGGQSLLEGTEDISFPDLSPLETRIDTLSNSLESKIDATSVDSKISNALSNFKQEHEHNKGLFGSEDDLPQNDLQEGDWAIVISGSTQTIWRYYDNKWNESNEYNLATEYDLSGYVKTGDLTSYAKLTDLPQIPTNVSQLQNDSNYATKSEVETAGNSYVKKSDVYTPEQINASTEGTIDTPGIDPYRKKMVSAKPVTGTYVTYDELTAVVKTVSGSGSGTATGSNNVVLEESEYNALSRYEDNVIYFVLEPQEQTNWTFGGTFPITFTEGGLGAFPITLT